ncbi:hypothetical protein NDN11_01500 [Acinetobacter sp. C26M]|uniref:hypothetical protein n=1 Tax=unclassified Acinetobacter TaxID=196816 RepID=UPI002036CC69|nr:MULTISPECIES: hypothetical protein [unclassified Acinetobacter]USA46843.1 hypothetical protein NDN11_01500 [Acinetobacter sp. C26M]USA50327.1 hypothetical protein NDN12_01500 [Acinetobacter sp. C26G]
MLFNQRFLLMLVLTIFSILYLFSAWVADDAYITFRTIENFHNGYGLRWNIDERVQSYTHPFWMLNLLIGKYIISDLYYLSLTIGFVYTFFSLIILYQLTKGEKILFISTAFLLLSSKAFLDFSSSGLENSASFFLIACFFYTFLKLKENNKFYLILSLIASTMFLNRMDLIIPLLPLIFYIFFIESYKLKKIKISIKQGLLGFTPVLLWCFFSTYYYGSFFPNSVIAKTNTGIPTSHLQIQGFQYLYSNILYDPFTSLIIYCVLIYTILSKKTKNKLLGLGLFLYLIYLISVGADYMYGRFLTIPFVISIFIIIKNKEIINNNEIKLITITSFLIFFNLYQYSIKDIESFQLQNSDLTDERAFYYKTTGLWPNLTGKNISIANHFLETGILFHEPIKKPTLLYTMGFNGYIASKVFPEKHIIDRLGLTDAFLAAHPMSYGYWRIGHFRRAVSSEYISSIEKNTNLIKLREDRYVLDQVYLLTRADLNDKRRFKAILNWNNGNTFEVAKKAFQHYPHHFMMNYDEKNLKNLWVPNNFYTSN